MQIRSSSAAALLVPMIGLAAVPAAAAPQVDASAMHVAQATASADRSGNIAAADVEVKVAADELEKARRRLDAGRQPSDQDRVNQLKGGGPMTDAYHLRVQALQQDVAKAQARLDRALAARKALDN
ncbi:MAG: hypothetical protein KJ025_21370 [Burkholderiales bacterium]|nr:hypothetical protein [Burkholderiales bacterium]